MEKKAAWMSPRVSHEVLTPFFKCVGNGAMDNHNARPAISYVATRPFELWTDIDVERFPGLADGIAEQYGKAWRNFGSPDAALTQEELKQKQRVSETIGSQLQEFSKENSPNAVAAALRELLLKYENLTLKEDE